MKRLTLRLCVLVGALVFVAGVLPTQATAPVPAPERRLYIVRLAGEPVLRSAPSDAGTEAALQAAFAEQNRTLAAIATVLGTEPEPRFSYTRALNGFALPLTPLEAKAVGRLPEVTAVVPDELQTLQSDSGPALIGAAQADLRPALFAAQLAPVQQGRTGSGRLLGVYNAATRSLQIQLVYRDLSGPPVGAALRLGDGGPIAADLARVAVAEGYVGTLPLADIPGGPSVGQIEAALMAGELMAEVRTSSFPSGEIGGRLAPVRGEGVLIGLLDSGIDPRNPSFANPAPDGYVFTNPFGPGVYRGVCSPNDADGRYDESFPCNAKLVGAYTYPDTDESPDPQGRPSPHDNHGHGSHTAGIAAGNSLTSVLVGGASIGPISGVAPHTNLIAYDVCGREPAGEPRNALTCSTAAIVAAIDQAMADGVDVLNHSIGSGSRNPWTSADSLGFLAALDKGMFVAASTGNTGPNPSTIGSPANTPWLTAVAAVNHGRSFANSLTTLSGGQADIRPSTLTGRGFAGAFGPAPLLIAAAFPNAQGGANAGCEPFGAGVNLQGAIVICKGGGLARPTMAANALAAGAGGTVIVNDAATGEALGDDVYPLPAVQIGHGAGQQLLLWANGCGDCRARIGGTTRVLNPSAADVLAGFSARGPDRTSPEVLKPDLAAPGVSVFAAGLDVNPGAPDYQLLSGTSMAAPHVAGAAALLRQLHPGWTPSEIRSALMLTAVTAVRKEDGLTQATPYDRGAGRIDVGRAALAGLVMDEQAARFRSADPARRGNPAALNLPGLVEAECAVTCVFTRTLRNALPIATSWAASGQGAAPLQLAIEPQSFTLAPGAGRTITITATIGQQPVGTSFFGAVTLTEQGNLAPAATLPLAARSAVTTLPPALAVTSPQLEGSTQLDARTWTIASLTPTLYGLVRLTPESVELAQDPTANNNADLAAGGILTRIVELAPGTTRFRVQIGATSAVDLDLYVFEDGDGDGAIDPGELLCSEAGPRSEEVCDIAAPDLLNGWPSARTLTVAVQNVLGSRPESPGFADRFVLSSATLGREPAGNLEIAGPPAAQAGELFRLELGWSLGAARRGDVFIGIVGLGSNPANPGDRGAFPFTVSYTPGTVSLPLVRRP